MHHPQSLRNYFHADQADQGRAEVDEFTLCRCTIRSDWLIVLFVENSCPDRFDLFVTDMNKTTKNTQKITPFLWFDDQATGRRKVSPTAARAGRDSAAYRAHGDHDEDELARTDNQRISGREDAEDYVTRREARKCPP